MTRILIAAVLVTAITVPTPLVAQAARPSAPADPLTPTRAERVRTLAAAGDHAAALVEAQAWAEAYPNEPIVRAAIYETMASLATAGGDAARAAQLTAMAEAIDPSLVRRLRAADPVTRGQQGQQPQRQRVDKTAIALGVALATLSAIVDARQQAKAARNAPPMNDPYSYPPAPVGMGGYAPPQGEYAPPPGYGPPQPGYGAPPPGYGAPQPGYGAPPPGYGAPPQAPQGQYGPPVPQYPQQTPYLPPQGYRAPQVRGGADPTKVVHDHSQAGDAAYFGAHACGALLKVSGTALTFTPSGGEAPLVIPVADIVELGMNASIGADLGAFHVVTSKGLYLNLAPASGGAAEGRRIVDSLQTQLNRTR